MLTLKYKADRKTLFVVLLYFVSTAFIWYYFPVMRIWLQIPAVAYLCTLSFMCAVIVHNTVHVPIFRSKREPDMFSHSDIGISWSPSMSMLYIDVKMRFCTVSISTG